MEATPPTPLNINGRLVGQGYPAYVVAEMSANHNQDFQRSVDILHAAKEAGADAVKLQTYTADTLTIRSDADSFRIKGKSPWAGRTLYDLYGEASTPWEWQPRLKKVADKIGIDLFSTPFDATSVDFLEKMRVPAFKIASFELVDLPLIRRVAKLGKPMVMSTGMATLSEIEEAVIAARSAGAKEIALLKCTSSYPAPADEMDLRSIPHLAETFQVPAGLSDHTMGATAAVVAVALGACIIEKHFTLSRKDVGPDSSFSMEPAEFRGMVGAIRVAERSVGGIHYGPTAHEQANLAFRRSLFVVKDVKKGERFTEENVRSIRPAAGLHTRNLDEVLGLVASADIPRGTPMRWSLVDRSTGATRRSLRPRAR